ncbi:MULTISPECIES: pirin family protein [unclassified Arcicella]|uniref:pirin family protein n=1 Tax=unclassified Arcicella TaxID=2644986 RepID=UPI0028551B81|nr:MULTISPECIES: pirin family protein [unclassified Arcicella]MDR6564912.1 redox-sensitive bicupin YhaK (pirin superfamily) [Arcicella sp. BE51]MDR6814702.1 redox-sensitive bicupin YhaK (pirin superfamily) [Arcicella sp. BE140]MDR6826135.1 redox-sensitive bicupin YhaK (pirin superfamily) [Arcicella sp. BE139]
METTLGTAVKKTLYKAGTRGQADHGWLKTRLTFSFAGYHDPKRVHFGVLRVLNDDQIAGGKGFGMHPHDNMEIITIPLEGVVEHRDNQGNHGIITKGEVQVMSAGTGVYHSEFNHLKDETLKLFQIWLFPNKGNVTPRYGQMKFDVAAQHNDFQLLVSPIEAKIPNTLGIHQDAYFSMGKFEAGQEFTYKINREGNGLFIMVVNGSVNAGGELLEIRDGLGLENITAVNFKTENGVELLLMEVPMELE